MPSARPRPTRNPRFPKPDACRPCALYNKGFGYAPPSGPEGAALTFLGEALGWEEAIAGEPFYGAAGGQLSRQCTRAGIDRAHCRIANIVSCQPPGDYLVGAPWEEHAIANCRQYLEPVLRDVPRDGVVIPLGATALTSVLGLRGAPGVSVRDFHGTVTRSLDDRYWVIPSFHPSFLQRGAMNLTDVVTQDIRKAHQISQTGFRRSPSVLQVDPHPEWFAKWVDDHLARVVADPESTHLAIDTEFEEKAGGVDESEVIVDLSQLSPLTRINGANDGVTGWTVPYREPYRSIAHQLLMRTSAAGGWIWMWHKYADLVHLWADGVAIANETVLDAMWLWHYLQSDLPRGLGFVAAMASDFGAWKHWAKIAEKEGDYAAADGLQTWRTSMWLLRAAIGAGIWDLYLRDWHERDVYILRAAHDMGTPINRSKLQAFHEELQRKLARTLEELKQTEAEGALKPKEGLTVKPKGAPCPDCVNGLQESTWVDDEQPYRLCRTCEGTGRLDPRPPASILNPPKKGGGEAKHAYMLDQVELVEREVEREIQYCTTCGAEQVSVKHRCPPLVEEVEKGVYKSGKKKGQPKRVTVRTPRTPNVILATRTVTRWYWRLPFNPDAPAQILAYLAQQGIDAPVDKKTKRATTNKKALSDLAKKHAQDPFFQLQMDWKAVQKVDSTYAVGSLNRLDSDDRLHPEFLPKPSTFRDSCQNPNLQNVVADKAGKDGLASGFRKTVEARDGLPPGVTDEEYQRWEVRWGI